MAAVTSGQGVLLPETTRSKRKQRVITVAVNSRDRNLGADYTSSNFRWSFQRPLKDVLSVELVNGSVPADLYTIAVGWNQFTFGEGIKMWQVTLTPGYYTPADIATEVQTQLNNLTGKLNIYTVTYSTTTRHLTITAAGLNPTPFTFYFMTSPFTDDIDTHSGCITSINNPGRIMGFEWADYTSVRGALTPPNRVDTEMFVKKVYLHINSDNSVELNRLEMGGGRKSCFHIIYMDQTSGYYSLNKDTHTPVFYSAPAPISRMATLSISLRDEFNRVLDIGNHDFTLMFEITVLE